MTSLLYDNVLKGSFMSLFRSNAYRSLRQASNHRAPDATTWTRSGMDQDVKRRQCRRRSSVALFCWAFVRSLERYHDRSASIFRVHTYYPSCTVVMLSLVRKLVLLSRQSESVGRNDDAPKPGGRCL